MTRAVAAALVVLVGAGAAACGGPADPDRPIVLAMAGSPANLDPAIGLDEASQKIGQLLFSSLLKIDGALRVVPDLASSFETRDYQTYVATIPAGVRFHDGREMTAEDVAYTFRRFLDKSFTSGRKGAYGDLQSVDVLEPYTVAFKLRRPSASFPINLIMGIVPKGAGAEFARAPVGSGPYRLAEFLPDDRVRLAPFSDHHRGAPRNTGLVFRTVPDDTMRGLELRKGSVDLIVNDLAPDLVHGLRERRELQVVTGAGTDYAYIGLNLRDPVLADRRVRQAIAFAVDQSAITEYMRRGLAQPAIGIVPPMSWAFDATVARYAHDPARARALLDEAGWPDPDGAGPAPRLHLTLKTSTSEIYRLQAAVLQNQLAEVGIAVTIRSQELATMQEDVAAGRVQMYTLQFVGITDPDILRRVFHSTQTPPAGLNRGHYANAEVDRLIDAASSTLDEAARLACYQEAQRLIAIDVPMVSLWSKTNVAVGQADLTGITLSPTAEFTFLKDVVRR
jgi:peptide/nickel transport system substrate-binding protein